MNSRRFTNLVPAGGRVNIQSLFTFAAIVLTTLLLFTVVTPVSAKGATQISGIGSYDDSGCPANPNYYDYAITLAGDLEGCQYITVDVDSIKCLPNGVYSEEGTEFYIITGGRFGAGTFSTTYRFSGRFDDCNSYNAEIFGRCQHPIIAGSGTGVFQGVMGRLDFKDDIAAGNAPYRGHMKWDNAQGPSGRSAFGGFSRTLSASPGCG